MNKVKPTVIIFVAIALFFAAMTIFGQNSKIKVERFDADITLDANGDMLVSETWVVNWPKDMHVSFRDIGYQKYNSDNPLPQEQTNRAYFDETSVDVKVYGADNVELNPNEYEIGYSFAGDNDELGNPVECYPYRSNCESLFVHVFAGMEETMTFQYDYKIIGAVTKYQDTNELNWVLLEYFESGIQSAKVTINVPSVAKEDIYAWGHGLSKGRVIIEDAKVTLDIDQIKESEALEFRILVDDPVFNVDAINFLDIPIRDLIFEYEDDLATKTNLSIFIANIIWVVAIVIAGLTVFVGVRVYIKYDKEYVAKFTGQYYRELPQEYSPAEMSYLYYFKKIQNEDVTATILDLVRRKYLFLEDNGSGINDKNPNFKIVKNSDKSVEDLLEHERHIIRWFIDGIGDKTEVTLEAIEKYPKKSYQAAMTFEKNASTFISLAKQAGAKHDFFESTLDRDRSKLYAWLAIPLIFAFIAMMAGGFTPIPTSHTLPMIIGFISAAGYGIYVASIRKRSINGNEDFTKWKAFRQFLIDFGNMDDYPMPGVVVWEHYLVYATSLKVADKVMDQLEVKLPKEAIESSEATYMGIGYRYYGFRLGYSLGRINQSVSTARANGHATIAAHQAQTSGGGRGGGFGGGRSFGGGGGGFRGR